MGSERVDPRVLGQHWRDKFTRSTARAMRVRARFPDQFVDVLYSDTASDATGTVRRIYDQLGLALDEHTAATMNQWLQANRREDRDPHRYTLEQFGFTREELEQDFADYRDMFLP
jgi:hypothetical protein